MPDDPTLSVSTVIATIGESLPARTKRGPIGSTLAEIDWVARRIIRTMLEIEASDRAPIITLQVR
jgi:hypothetical protein